jgi:sulfoxide reductase heme-binding subunit YedZ
MLKLIPYIRKIVWVFAGLLAFSVWIKVQADGGDDALKTLILAQSFAKLAYVFLLATLFASPLYIVFPKLPWKPLYIKARKALGVSTFFFVLLHWYYAFFGLLGGFANVKFFSSKILLATMLGHVSLIILAILATTSLTFLIHKLGRHWKPLHRLVYIVAILVPIHALLIGSEFQNPDDLGANLLLFATLLLLMFEEIRFYKFLTSKYPNFPKHIFSLILTGLFIGIFYIVFFSNIFVQHG